MYGLLDFIAGVLVGMLIMLAKCLGDLAKLKGKDSELKERPDTSIGY